MISLHNAIEDTRSLIKWGVVTCVVVLILLFLFRAGTSLKESLFPTPKTPPTVLFGKLPNVVFPKNTSDITFSYSINTITGALPVFADRIKVYKMIKPSSNLLALKRAQERVGRLGFTSPGRPISETIYQWNDSAAPPRRIILDILSLNFSLTSNFLFDNNVVSGKNRPGPQEAASVAQGFVSALDAFSDDIDITKTRQELLTIRDTNIVSATSLSNTKVIRIDFFQKDIEKTPIFYQNPPYSSMNAFVAGGKSSGQVILAEFTHHDVNLDNFATYPIISSAEAFDNLKQRKAYIANYSGNNEHISIQDVFLAYYMPKELPDYLMPIVVFVGNDNFFAYVPAITKLWIQE